MPDAQVHTLLDRIIGHVQERSFLRRLMERRAVPHALLFCGPAGVGKRTVAQAFAASLLTRSAEEAEEMARLTASGSHPDLHMVFRESGKKDITVEAVRSLCHDMQLKPYYSHASTAVIDNAHHMNLPAANALLKTLEEPNDNGYLLLVTNSPHRLPETIISRCQVVYFSELHAKECAAVIERLFAELLTEKQRAGLARLAGTSLLPLDLNEFVDPRTLALNSGRALKDHLSGLLDQAAAFDRRLIELCRSADSGRALSLAVELAADKDHLPSRWRLLTAAMRRQLRGADAESKRAWAELLLDCLEAERLTAERNLNPQLQLSSVLLKLSELEMTAAGGF